MDLQSHQAKEIIRAAEASRDKSQQRKLALVVGIFAFLLPTFLWLGPKFLSGCERYSLSHYYYSPFWGGVFIGMLAFIGTYLITYRGDTRRETWVASIAGIGAFGVAFLPTDGHGCLRPFSDGQFRARAFAWFNVDDKGIHSLAPSSTNPDLVSEFFTLVDTKLLWTLDTTHLHYISATVLFAALLYFCFVVFVHVEPRHLDANGDPTHIKKTRNAIYRICGSVILLSIFMLGKNHFFGPEGSGIDTAWNRARGTFWWEAIAIWAFGVSWLVKGRFVPWLVDESEKALTGEPKQA